jgi:hypothetical protein
MDDVIYIVRAITELLLWPFDQLPDWASLTLISLLSGVVMLWVVGKTTAQRRIERARDRMTSAVYEVRLFLDSPRRVIAAQGQLLGSAAIYIGLLLPALLILSAPLGLLYLHLDARYALDPLPVGRPLVVQVDLAKGTGAEALKVERNADGARGVEVTAPPVHLADRDQLFLRVQLRQPGQSVLRLRIGDELVTKKLSAEREAPAFSEQRLPGIAGLWALGLERPLPSNGTVRAIQVAHPRRAENWLGLGLPWWAYWLIVATAAALALHRRLGVAL